jgi:hypothetical protein
MIPIQVPQIINIISTATHAAMNNTANKQWSISLVLFGHAASVVKLGAKEINNALRP